MSGTVEVPSDVIPGRQFQSWSLSPELLELVAAPGVLGEHVEHGIEVVEDDPARRPLTLGTAGEQAPLALQAQPNLIDDRLRLPLVSRSADRQVVGVGDELSHVED